MSLQRSATLPERLHLTLVSDPVEIADARKAVEAYVVTQGMGQRCADELGLAVNEALANVIRHAYKGQHDGKIELTAAFTGDELELLIRDWGNGVVPDLTREKKNLLQPGGLGLPCMKEIADGLEFIPQPDGMLLRMTKRKR